MVLYGSMEAAKLRNPLKVESKMADDAQIFDILDPYIFRTAKARDFKFDVCIDCEE